MSTADELRQLRELVEKVTSSHRSHIRSRGPDPEDLDPTPVEMPVGMDSPPSMREMVQEYIRDELSKQAAEEDFGTFEQEDDFEPEEEELLSLSGFEVSEFDMVEDDPTPVENTPETPPEPPEAEPPPVETPEVGTT